MTELGTGHQGAAATASVTAAFRKVVGPKGMQWAEHRIALVEAQLAPVVRAAAPAWVEAAAAAAEGGGKPEMRDHNSMSSLRRLLLVCFLLALFFFCASRALLVSQTADAQEKAAAVSSQKTFATANDAVDAFLRAADSYDVAELTAILGPDGEDLIESEDQVRDKNITAEFSAKAKEKHSLVPDAKDPNRSTLVVGNDDWPLPIPIVRQNGKWHFDTKAGRQEMLFRRIGANELDAIEICRGYVEAQHEYAMTKHDNSEVNQYAQKIISTPGKRDGLAWRNPDGSLGGPIAQGIADAIQQGYTDKTKPYHGYFFKILKGQGPHAPLGQLNFLVEGAMIGGFALAAAPAEYRVTGVKTFMVGYDGIVYQKDLGPDTLTLFQKMELYDPDSTWKPTEDEWPWDEDNSSTATAERQ